MTECCTSTFYKDLYNRTVILQRNKRCSNIRFLKARRDVIDACQLILDVENWKLLVVVVVLLKACVAAAWGFSPPFWIQWMDDVNNELQQRQRWNASHP